MTPKKSSQKAFSSFRIIGKKAQNVLKKAKQSDGSTKKARAKLPKKEHYEELVIHLSIRSVVRASFAILAVVVGMWLFYHLRHKIFLLLLASFVAAVVDPGVQSMERAGFPRGIAILVHYFLGLFILFFLLFSLIPIIAIQLQQIAVFIGSEVDVFLSEPEISLPLVSADLNRHLTNFAQLTLQDLSITEFADALQQFGQNLSSAAQGSVRFAAQLAGSVVNFFVSLILVLVLAFFIQLDKERIVSWIRGFLPQRYRMYADHKSEAIHHKIGQWARGEILLMLSIFAITLTALLILRMPYALTLAVLAGFCEFIPAVGPFIAAIPAVIIALSQEGIIWALVIAGVYYVIQWCENNLLVPLIMKRAVGLSPIAILFAMMVGISFPNTVHPVIGIMLAVPATTILAIFLEDWREISGKN